MIYGIRCLEVLKKDNEIETHLIVSEGAEKTIALETDRSAAAIKELADFAYSPGNLAAPVASGSFPTHGMVVCPCTMKTLSGIVNSYNENLLVRAADVTLKEHRKLIVVPRETPLHKGHLEMMVRLADLGGIVLPPVPAFYHHPRSVEDMIDFTVGKLLDQFGIRHELFDRWQGPKPQ